VPGVRETCTQADVGASPTSPVFCSRFDYDDGFEAAVTDIGPVSHVRLNIFPDGGLSRLRLYGTIGGG
jgi:allantoicase